MRSAVPREATPLLCGLHRRQARLHLRQPLLSFPDLLLQPLPAGLVRASVLHLLPVGRDLAWYLGAVLLEGLPLVPGPRHGPQRSSRGNPGDDSGELATTPASLPGVVAVLKPHDEEPQGDDDAGEEQKPEERAHRQHIPPPLTLPDGPVAALLVGPAGRDHGRQNSLAGAVGISPT